MHFASSQREQGLSGNSKSVRGEGSHQAGPGTFASDLFPPGLQARLHLRSAWGSFGAALGLGLGSVSARTTRMGSRASRTPSATALARARRLKHHCTHRYIQGLFRHRTLTWRPGQHSRCSRSPPRSKVASLNHAPLPNGQLRTITTTDLQTGIVQWSPRRRDRQSH